MIRCKGCGKLYPRTIHRDLIDKYLEKQKVDGGIGDTFVATRVIVILSTVHDEKYKEYKEMAARTLAEYNHYCLPCRLDVNTKWNMIKIKLQL